MRTLVVYYSLTNHTKGLAERIASECNADLEQIKDVKVRTGLWGMISTGREALFKRQATIQPAEKDPTQYDLIILGTPVWAWTMSSPMRTYITKHAPSFENVAFFCTEGGTGGERTFAHMSELVGKQPIATLEITETDLKTRADGDKLKRFTSAIARFFNSVSTNTSEAERLSPRDAA